MFQRQVSRPVISVVKSGFVGFCSVSLCFFGFFLLVVSATLIGTSYDSNFQAEFFQAGNRGKRIAGFIILTIAIIICFTAFAMCCYVCKAAKDAQHQQGTITNAGPIVSGQAAPNPVSGYHMQTNQPHQPYPGAGQYPVAGVQPYPPTSGPGAYPPTSGPGANPPAMAPGPYPQQQPQQYPPPQYPPPQNGPSPTAPTESPPSYYSAVEEKSGML